MKVVYFVCVGNSCRSQMAEGFARHHGKGRVEAHSAGTRPADRVSGKATQVMAENGVDISGQRPKQIDMALARRADRVISMGCGVEASCPAKLAEVMEDWGIDDPYGGDIDTYRRARDEIEKRVLALLDALGVAQG